MNENSIEIAEKALFERYAYINEIRNIPILFILASPRTGSTLAYQFFIEVFGLYYFSNFVAERFFKNPVVGVSLDIHANPRKPLRFHSNYGKTDGTFEPSEASWIFKNWFGGEHPSQTKSAKILEGQTTHMKRTMSAIYEIAGCPLVTKNAWNCFRIKELCHTFTGGRFVWLRRDIVSSAISDLEARYNRGGPESWNSATTKNYKEIKKLPYWEQVVEQQYEYNQTLQKDLRKYSSDKFIEIWYEELCTDTENTVEQIENIFGLWGWQLKTDYMKIPKLKLSNGPSCKWNDIQKIETYIANNSSRFESYIWSNKR